MSMYPQHRGLPQNASRLNELLDQIRAEFDNQVRLNEGYEQQSKLAHSRVTGKLLQSLELYALHLPTLAHA